MRKAFWAPTRLRGAGRDPRGRRSAVTPCPGGQTHECAAPPRPRFGKPHDRVNPGRDGRSWNASRIDAERAPRAADALPARAAAGTGPGPADAVAARPDPAEPRAGSGAAFHLS